MGLNHDRRSDLSEGFAVINLEYGGEGGSRTHTALVSPNCFQDSDHRQLVCLSMFCLVPKEGLEPSRPLRPAAFEAGASTNSATSAYCLVPKTGLEPARSYEQ